MVIAVWQDKYNTGIPEIDRQHQELFRTIERFYAAVKGGAGPKQVGETLGFLLDYTRSHFEAEENLMRLHGYPGLAKHKIEHDKLIKDVIALKDKYEAGQSVMMLEVSGFLLTWLKHHISETDLGYVAFFKNKGVC